MKQNQANLNDMLSSPQAKNLLNNKQALESILKSGEAQRLMELLNKNAGSGLKNAAQSAMQGDASQLKKLVDDLMQNPESARLVEDLNKKVK